MSNQANITGTRYGLICGLTSAIVNVIIYSTELYVFSYLSAIVLLIPALGIVFAHFSIKQEENGVLLYWVAVRSGTIVGTINSWCAAIIGHFYLTYINSTPLHFALEKQREKLYHKGLSEDLIDQIMRNNPSSTTTLLMGLLAAALVSFIGSLAISFFTKRQEPMSPFENF